MIHPPHRGRLVATAVAAAMTVAAVILAAVATVAQKEVLSPSASAANPARERNLAPSRSPGPPGPTTAASSAPTPKPVIGPVLARSTPVSLDVPRIGIRNARLVTLGLARDGSIQVPATGRNSPAGWFRHSPTPGQLGPSVILGHLDSLTAGPAIFYRLATLRPGDTVTVTRADDTVAVFRVGSVNTYAKSTFPTLQVYGDTDHAALRLITCGGAFDPAKDTYEDNVVVYAHLASSHRA